MTSVPILMLIGHMEVGIERVCFAMWHQVTVCSKGLVT